MSIGNFSETNDSSDEVKETKESTDNTEKPKNQILENADGYDDDFDKKLDSMENNESKTENSDNKESDSGEKGGEEKQSLLDKMRNLFSRKESGRESETETKEGENTESDKNDFASRRSSFMEYLREGAPTTEEQAETSKKWQEGKKESGSDGGENNDETKSEGHGEDGERTLWSDAQWRQDHER